MGRDGRTGRSAADGGHLIERLAVQLRLGDIRLEERDEQMLGQIQWCLAVQEGVQKAPKAIEVNVLRGVREGGRVGQIDKAYVYRVQYYVYACLLRSPPPALFKFPS